MILFIYLLFLFLAKFVDEVIKAGGVKIAASLLSEENMHYTYTGALLMANLAQHAGAMPALIQERAYAPLMDWLVRTQTSTVPQTETKGQVIRALRAMYVGERWMLLN